MLKSRLSSTILQPANAPTAAESSFHSIGASSNGASSSTSAPDPEDSALQQIRSMRASSELENRKKNNYMDRASVAEAPQLHSWPVRLIPHPYDNPISVFHVPHRSKRLGQEGSVHRLEAG